MPMAEERQQTRSPSARQTDNCTYGLDEESDLIWYVSPRVHFEAAKEQHRCVGLSEDDE
jgi:hypothetical protein